VEPILTGRSPIPFQPAPTATAQARRGEPSVRAGTPRALGLDPRLSLGAIAAALAAGYALLLLWPMRIWSREVSPHTHLVGTFGVDRVGAMRYLLTVAVLFGLYGAALWLVLTRRVRTSLLAVLSAATVFCSLLVLTHPLTSADVFNYIVSARVQWVHGDNPLTTPPLAYPDDPFFRMLFFWRDVPSPYGPVWSLITAVPHALGGGDALRTVVAFKATAAGFLLATGLLAGLAAERLRRGSGSAAALALTWNPLVVWHVAGNGHNDAVMVFFLALAVYLIVRDAPGLATLALALSALVKFATLLLIPVIVVWWWRRRDVMPLRSILPWVAIAAATAVLAYLPYWDGAATFRTSLDEGSYFALSAPAALRGALARVTSEATADLVAAWTGRLAFLALYGLVLAWLWRALRPAAGVPGATAAAEPLIVAGCAVLTAYLLVAATYFAPWYVIWPLTLGVLVPWRRELLVPLLALSLGSMSVLLWATWARARLAPDPLSDWYPMHLLSCLSVTAPPAALWYWMARMRRARDESRQSADIESPVLESEVARAGSEG
jgi:hypothetical protein